MALARPRPASPDGPAEYSDRTRPWAEGNHGNGRLMFATIYLPDFYLQAALRHQPDLSGKPIALLDDQEKKAVIIQLNSAAEKTGVRVGMTPSQGLARYLDLEIGRASCRERV